MAYPEYSFSTLPAIQTPLQVEKEQTTQYLGGRAVTGEEYATLNFFIDDNTQAKALYDFWKDDCNYGTKPFLMPLPVFGVSYSRDSGNALCKFIDKPVQQKEEIYSTQSTKVKILEYSELLGYVVDDIGNNVVDDSGNRVIAYSKPISNSNKEITYG